MDGGVLMKRFICFALLMTLLAGALPLSARATVSDVMAVTKCSEWVSLRQAADKGSKRLAKVYLGELVSQCWEAENGFIHCNYHGTNGYILAQYLKTTGFTNGDELLHNQMVINVSDWVSLRQYADAKSKRLAKVPVGAIVTECVREGDFVICVYQKKTGYIAASYLKNANYNVSKQDSSVVKKAANAHYPTYSRPMTVINTKDWVSLREKASASSSRLAKVPLGATVSHCVQVSEKFIYCEYKGIWGYILREYLQSNDPRPTALPTAVPTAAPLPTIAPAPTAFSAAPLPVINSASKAAASFDQLPDWPSYTQLLSVGDTVLNYHAPNGYTVVAQRLTGDNKEEIKLICYDANARPVWQTGDSTQKNSELHPTHAFIAGTEEKPRVVLFTSGKGFVAYDVDAWHDIQWSLTEGEALGISGSLRAETDRDGTMYVIGYYDGAPACISADGKLLWRATNADPNIYWPMDLIIEDDHIEVYFSTPLENDIYCDVISYDKNGNLLTVQRKPRQYDEGNG